MISEVISQSEGVESIVKATIMNGFRTFVGVRDGFIVFKRVYIRLDGSSSLNVLYVCRLVWSS